MISKITTIALITAFVSPMAATAGGIAPELNEAPVTVVSDPLPIPLLVGSLSPVAVGAAALVGAGVLAAVAGGGDSSSDTQ